MAPVSPLQDKQGPLPEEDEPFGPSEGFANVHEAPDVDGDVEPESGRCGEDERSDEVEEAGQRAVPIPSPGTHTREEYMKHCLTHTPYRNWCPFCVKGQKHNQSHASKPKGRVEIPTLAVDYCFI